MSLTPPYTVRGNNKQGNCFHKDRKGPFTPETTSGFFRTFTGFTRESPSSNFDVFVDRRLRTLVEVVV